MIEPQLIELGYKKLIADDGETLYFPPDRCFGDIKKTFFSLTDVHFVKKYKVCFGKAILFDSYFFNYQYAHYFNSYSTENQSFIECYSPIKNLFYYFKSVFSDSILNVGNDFVILNIPYLSLKSFISSSVYFSSRQVYYYTDSYGYIHGFSIYLPNEYYDIT